MRKLLSLCLCALLLCALASCTREETLEELSQSQAEEETSREETSYDIDARSVYDEEESDNDGYATPRANATTSRSAGTRSKSGLRGEDSAIGIDPGTPGGTAALTLEAFRSWDRTALDRYLQMSSYYSFDEYFPKEADSFCQRYLRRMSYQVLDERVDGESAEVDLSITAPSAMELMEDVLEDVRRQIAAGNIDSFDYFDYYDEAFLFSYLSERLRDDLSLKTSKVTVYLDKDEETGDWFIDMTGYKNDPFMNAVFGGMEEAFETVGDELFELLWSYYY